MTGVGSYKKRLKDHPEKERALWRIFDRTPLEDGVALERATDDDACGCSTARRTSIC